MAAVADAKQPDKIVATTTVEPTTDAASNEEQGVHQQPDRDVKNAIWTIVTGVALPCIPIIIILSILLYFIFHRQVKPWEGYPELTLNTTDKATSGINAVIAEWRHQGGQAAYLVNFNPSTLTTIASWTSRIIPYLTSSIMALVAFFAARYIVSQSEKGDEAVLPDAEQLTLLIGMLGGSGFAPLKETVFYRWLKKERLVSPVPVVFWVLMFISVLGIVIPAVDTWFGIATHPVTITMLSNTTLKQQYGRVLNAQVCPDGPNIPKGQDTLDGGWPEGSDSIFWPCSIDVGFTNVGGIGARPRNMSDATRLQYGLPVSTSISNHTTDNATNWFYYTDPLANSTLDFQASSIAITTQCKPITFQCTSGPFGDFNCSSGFSGNYYRPWPYVMNAPPNNVSTDNVPAIAQGIYFASDAELSSTPSLLELNLEGSFGNYTWPTIVPSNPSNFVTYSYNLPNTDFLSLLPDYNQSEMAGEGGSGNIYFLQCATTVADLTYTHVSGNLSTFTTTPSTPELAALFTGPYSISNTFGNDSTLAGLMSRTLQNLATLSFVSSNSTTELANIWADEFSKTSLVLSIGAFTPTANTLEQTRDPSVIVARVPLVPLYLLIALKLIYVLAVIVLAVGAYAFTHPAETEVVKAQLSTKGLAAAHFDQPDLLQSNAVKAVEAKLTMSKRATTEPAPGSRKGSATADPQAGGLKRAATSPAMVVDGDGSKKPRVGLVPNAEGLWKFVVMADGVWCSISPVVKNVVQVQAKEGDLGGFGGLVNAWKG